MQVNPTQQLKIIQELMSVHEPCERLSGCPYRPVFINPANNQEFFVLTIGRAHVWAREISKRHQFSTSSNQLMSSPNELKNSPSTNQNTNSQKTESTMEKISSTILKTALEAIPLLTTDNYTLWRNRIDNMLDLQGLQDSLTSEKGILTSSDDVSLRTIITSKLDSSIHPNVINHENEKDARKIWTSITDYFASTQPANRA
ncbi:hypothetical protein PGT21_032557 [Puccinia graminis f. sp. tritici]|uniref:DUF4219 domain-containing protein n=1 Tax=Puccinia graminis f. sp. tritici TaxID=56615 RepID=A0A5B0MWX3_PUCGR|nr:hypothetical protein PGT21_032557 [Puccinia graminis f. sp. tritici]KAA1130220.1 hypothetical protein PGTUg99_009757 [Puccinia graminis f. sp. tritici]